MTILLRRLVVILLVAVGAVGVLAPPALAGGPTSVLLVAPGTGRTASLSFEDSDYVRLQQLLDERGAAAPSDASAVAAPSAGLTVTWLIHNVSIWRVDLLTFLSDGAIVVTTRGGVGAEGEWDIAAVSSLVARPRELTALLTRLGVHPGGGAASAAQSGSTAATPAAVASSTPGTASADRLDAPTWGLAGVAIGIGLALLGRSFLTRAAVILRQRNRAVQSDRDDLDVELTL